MIMMVEYYTLNQMVNFIGDHMKYQLRQRFVAAGVSSTFSDTIIANSGVTSKGTLTVGAEVTNLLFPNHQITSQWQ